jgi:hypothetical protein
MQSGWVGHSHSQCIVHVDQLSVSIKQHSRVSAIVDVISPAGGHVGTQGDWGVRKSLCGSCGELCVATVDWVSCHEQEPFVTTMRPGLMSWWLSLPICAGATAVRSNNNSEAIF